MKGNDLDNRPTPRYYVMADAVFTKTEHEETTTTGRWRKKTVTRTVVVWLPDHAVLSELWRFSDRYSVRMELIFAGDMATSGPELWDLLERTPNAHPFTDWHIYEDIDSIVRSLPYRPDLRGVIDIPTRSGVYGGIGLTIGALR